MNHDLRTVDLKSRDTPDWRESLISQVSEFVSFLIILGLNLEFRGFVWSTKKFKRVKKNVPTSPHHWQIIQKILQTNKNSFGFVFCIVCYPTNMRVHTWLPMVALLICCGTFANAAIQTQGFRGSDPFRLSAGGACDDYKDCNGGEVCVDDVCQVRLRERSMHIRRW